MSTYATRLASHASLIRRKSGTFRRLLLFFMRLLWESSPRLLLLSVFSALASRALTVLSFLGTLQLAYLVFYPPSRLIAVLQPAVDITGLTPTALIAATSAIIIIGIFTTAAIMTIVEAHYRDKLKRQLELFLAESLFKAKPMADTWSPKAPSKLLALSNLANNAINALSLSAMLIGISTLLFIMSPLIAVALIFCTSLAFGLVLYFGVRARKRSEKFARAHDALNETLKATSPEIKDAGPETDGGKNKPDKSLVLARMQTAHDARSRVSEFRTRLDSIALMSTGILVGIAILMMIDANVVYVILTLLLVRFFLNYSRSLAQQLQRISDQLDVLDWACITFSKCIPAK